jgi:hypothetical protein
MRKRLLILDGVVLAVAVLAGVLLPPGRPKTQLRAQYDRVRRGMTPEEVHAIMGEPNYYTHPWPPGQVTEVFGDDQLFVSIDLLIIPESKESVYILFTDGRVTRKTYQWEDRHEPTALERMLAPAQDWLGW